MYVGGLLPGLFMILALSALGVARSVRDKVPRVPFQLREAIAALRGAALEILLPVFVLLFYFLGIMTVVETAAFSVVYVFLAEVLVHGDIRLRRIPEVFLKAAVIIGGVLVILAAANGLSYFIVDA
jgi:C4-dicarboxylate transporter DctM subunit